MLPSLSRTLSELGANIRTARLRRRLSIVQVAERAGITVDPVSVVDGNKSYVRVSGGTAGADYWLTCTITLSDTPAQTETRSFRVRVVDRRAL